ncbi:MAG: hypothetical protein K2J30_00295, partial [Clostridia bacterium]|nr:hypothetical protein [Clostridia bacterium]
IMMSTFLGIYGSFNFIFADYTLHDFGYVRELEQTISINLPDSGYISRAINTTPATNTFAMIKFDNADEVSNTLFHDNRFSEVLSFIPANFIDSYYMNLTWKSHYYMLFDVTSNEVNVMPHSQSEVHRYIFIAYNMHKNILFVLDFMK